jgi:hypothetical protein
VVVALAYGCGSQQQAADLKIDQVYLHFEDVVRDETRQIDEWKEIAQVLNKFGCRNCYAIEGEYTGSLLTKDLYDYEVTLKWSPPRTTADLDLLHGALLALDRLAIDLALEAASGGVWYRGLAATGRITIIVRIEVSPGSELYLDRHQTGDFVYVETPDDVFRDEITIRKGQEWLYYKTRLTVREETKTKYFRLNIVTQLEEELSEHEFRKALKGE